MEEKYEHLGADGYALPPEVPRREYPIGGREWAFALLSLICGLLLCNFVLFGGFNLGFAVGMILNLLTIAGYLRSRGCRLRPYSGLLLGLSLIISGGFARSEDGFVKFVMVCFLFVGVNLGLTTLAGKNRRAAAGFSSLADVFYTAFARSFQLDGSFYGLRTAFRKSGAAAKKGGAIALGMLAALPLVLVMVFLLMRADAAFEGLVDRLPDFRVRELVPTVLFGGMLFCLSFTKGLALAHQPGGEAAGKNKKGISSLTVNTVLIAVCGLYLVYLFSQLAYFAGGLAGFLPEGYTMADYARRGFFEMAWLCAINLGILGLSIGLVGKKPGVPVLTKVLCLFISLITVFFVVAASGKMFLYIGAYGLTRLRVLTQVIMLFLCLTTVFVALWILAPEFPYMKAVILAGMIIGAVVFWADMDTVVARYNVNAYLSGKLESVDMAHLSDLGPAAIPYIGALAEKAPDAFVRNQAKDILENTWYSQPEDFRGWNYSLSEAKDFLPATVGNDQDWD